MASRSWLPLVVTLACLAGVTQCVTYVNRSQGIREFPDDIPWNVEKIDLTNNDIGEVYLSKEYPYLKRLVLQGNNLTRFPTTAHNVSNAFKNLVLSGNSIRSIDVIETSDNTTFENLTILLLDSNELTVFPDLTNVSYKLQQLYLQYNHITTIPFKRLNVLEHLNFLGLSNNPITFIPDTTFLGQIRKISLVQLNMTHFPHIPNLLYSTEEIYFDDNTNGFIFDYVDNYTSLTKLTLRKCAYRGDIPSFTNVSSTLQVLDLTDSGVERLPDLGSLNKLQWLILNQNPISVFPDANLGSPQLVIELKDVAITEFPILPIIGPILTTLSISNNNLTINYIGHLDNLVKLQMQNCKYGGYFPNLANVSQKLEYLQLSDNDIYFINPEYLDALVKLKELLLYNNPISIIPDVPGPGATLTVIELSNSTLMEFPHIPRLGRSLRKLRIKGEYQRYEKISLESLQGLPRLEQLDISESPVKNLPDVSRLNLAKPLYINMAHTIIDCDNNVKMLKFMTKRGIIKIQQPQPLCMRSSAFKGNVGSLGPAALKAVHVDGRLNHGSSRRLTDVAHFHGYVKVDKVLPDTVKGSCSLQCMFKEDCLMFATDDGNCALTSWASGTKQEFQQYSQWFILD